MHILSASLEQFRSFGALQLDLADPNVHVLLGPNGSGKTNVLEALWVLSLTRSFLPVEETDIVQWGKEFYRLRAELEDDLGEKSTIEIVSQMQPRKQKACFINDVKKSITETVGHVPTVAFLPQDLDLFSGPPTLRRRFIDTLLSQVSPEYAQALMQYMRVLKQRNVLLKKINEGLAKKKDLETWDQMLSESGALVTLKRLELIEVFQCTFLEELSSLGESWDDAKLVYERSGEARNGEELVKEMNMLLKLSLERDILLQSTSVGPHRDDWQIDIEERELSTFASRGQQRSAVLALVFLKVSFLELGRGEKPIVLLDDVFSELDDAHQTAVLKSFDDYQVFVTATHAPQVLEGAKVWEMSQCAASLTCTERSRSIH